MNEACILITGLPASGKSMLGRKLAKAMDIPLLDKDDYLEKLYDSEGVGNEAKRRELSQQSNRYFQKDALKENRLILVSHWAKPGGSTTSGTPTDWVVNSYSQIIEVYCHCSIEISVDRFINRCRHPGHLDGNKGVMGLTKQFELYSRQLPLGIGELLKVDTTQLLQTETLVKEIVNCF